MNIEPDEGFDWVETISDDDGDDYRDRDYLDRNYVPGDMTTQQYQTLIDYSGLCRCGDCLVVLS